MKIAIIQWWRIKRLMKWMSGNYGNGYVDRVHKLREECLELVEAIDAFEKKWGKGASNGHDIMRIEEKIADVVAVAAHAEVCNYKTILDAILTAGEKMKKREEDPNYMR